MPFSLFYNFCIKAKNSAVKLKSLLTIIDAVKKTAGLVF